MATEGSYRYGGYRLAALSVGNLYGIRWCCVNWESFVV